MIEKMTKYTFIMLGSSRDSFLESLQSIGLIDIKRSRKPVDDYARGLYEESLERRKLIERIEKDDFSRDASYVHLSKSLDAARKEYASLLPWGSFSPSDLKGLAAAGFDVRFYCVPVGKFSSEWADIQALEIISRDERNVWFVTVGGDSLPVEECPAPSRSYEEVAIEIAALEKELADKEEALRGEKALLPQLRRELSSLLEKLARYQASAAAVKAAEDSLDIFVGFAPTASDASLASQLDSLGVYYLSEPATKEDNPPIKLHNNWFARNFETLTGMYGMPVYDEFDPTPVLAPFFLLFWAFCMGDAGYGLLLIAMGFVVKRVNILGLKPHWRLVTTLGVGATIIGFFLATFFGINLTTVEWIPEGLRSLMLSGKLSFGGSSYDVSMVAAIAIGIFHICLAMVIKAIGLTKRFGLGAAISTWGWIVLIVGGLCTAGLALTSVIDSSVTRIVVIVIGVIALLSIYLFNTPGRNPAINFGAGLWDTYQMATGILGDVLSYIRLYALGLAGGMLGGAFNDLAAMTLGDNPTWQFLPFILIFVLGHALNFAMSCLGAFVHPLRLTFVEYFKNSGYEGKGDRYEPLQTIEN